MIPIEGTIFASHLPDDGEFHRFELLEAYETRIHHLRYESQKQTKKYGLVFKALERETGAYLYYKVLPDLIK